jgi:hypothetical protein
VGWTQKRKTKDGVGRFRACYRDIRGQVQSARTFAKEREADKAVDVTRSVAYFHNANITQPRWSCCCGRPSPSARWPSPGYGSRGRRD